MSQEDEEAGVGSGARLGSGGARRRMLRRNSVSMILENPVLAQVLALFMGGLCVLHCVRCLLMGWSNDPGEPGAGAGALARFCFLWAVLLGRLCC